MSSNTAVALQPSAEDWTKKSYEHGFITAIESDSAPPGLSEDTVRYISAKKNEPEWLLEFRLRAFAHFMKIKDKSAPTWANLKIAPIDSGLDSSETQHSITPILQFTRLATVMECRCTESNGWIDRFFSLPSLPP